MSIDTTPPTTGKPKPTPKPHKARQAATTLTVPAKPAAISAVNVATLAGTAAASTGPVGWVVVGGAAAATGAAVVVRRVVRRRRDRAGFDFGGLGALGRDGRMRWPRPGGGGAPSPSGGSRSPRRHGGLPRLGLGFGSDRRRNVAAGSGGGSGGRRRAAAGGAPGTRGGSTTGGLGTGTTRGPGRGPVRHITPAVARAAWRATKAAARGTRHTLRATRRHLGRPLWRWGRRLVRRHILGHEDRPRQPKSPKPNVGSKVNRPDQPGVVTSYPPSVNTSSTRKDRIMPAANPNQKPPAPVGPVYQAARQVHAVAVQHVVKGNLELRAEAYEFPFTIAELAAAIRARATYCTRESIDPAYGRALMQIATTVDAAAHAAANLGQSFDALHGDKVKRLLQPGPNEQKWDTSHNRA